MGIIRSLRCGQFIAGLSILLLTGCVSIVGGQSNNLASGFYCGNSLVYDMCAQDPDSDGEVELVYFANSNEGFLYRKGTDGQVRTSLTMHECALPMDEDIIRTTSKLFYISDDTNLLRITDIKGVLMFSYVSTIPKVANCNSQYSEGSHSGDEFDFEF